jgi:hypothetical protein
VPTFGNIIFNKISYAEFIFRSKVSGIVGGLNSKHFSSVVIDKFIEKLNSKYFSYVVIDKFIENYIPTS